MRFAILGSGSQGNCLVVEARNTRLLLDCGFSVGETVRRLTRLGIEPGKLSGILVTHEHEDHIGGVARLARKLRLPVWLTPGTLRGLEGLFAGMDGVHLLEGYAPLCIGDLEVHPFPVPHDAREPAQYVIGDGVRRLGVLTDAGCVTPLMVRMLSACDALVLESNHDPDLLAAGDYPPALKQRIASRYGHLDNAAAAALLGAPDCSRLQHLVAAHLSQNNNRPELARQRLADVLACAPHWVAIADQDTGLDGRHIA
ncbi:MAG TPA: MBL fold metallo-hydrolase [Burkholderiales bacterium]|nr:MBL fold metallo-hydrolase [Burkholderiales bacterium]